MIIGASPAGSSLNISFQIALAAVGSIDGLLDYSRIRNDMSSMIY